MDNIAIPFDQAHKRIRPTVIINVLHKRIIQRRHAGIAAALHPSVLLPAQINNGIFYTQMPFCAIPKHSFP